MRAPQCDSQAGFSLVEVLVAFTILLVGMVGVLSLFSTALGIQAEAQVRQDVARHLPAVLSEIEASLAGLRGSNRAIGLSEASFPVPGDPRYRYRVRTEGIPGDQEGRGVFARIEILSRRRGEERVFDFGWMTVVPEPDADALIQKLSTER